MSFYDRGNTNT